MKLMISQNIDSNRVRLEFKKGPNKPDNSPSYVISPSKADEFVLKYNSQEDNLKRTTAWIMTGFGLGSLFAAIKTSLGTSKNKVLKISSILAGGLLSGGLISAIISSNQKNKLMDEYKVSTYHK